MKTSHFHPAQTVEHAEKKLEEAVLNNVLIDRERDLILEFLRERTAVSGHFSESRYYKVAGSLRMFREGGFLQVPWSEITMQEYLMAVGTVRRKEYSEETKRDYIVLSRMFYRWLIEKGYVEGDLIQLQKVQSPPIPKPVIKKEFLMSEENVLAMIRVAASIRDKAMIAVWYECALRANEVAGLDWENITYEDQSAQVTVVDTKENTRRTAFVIAGLEHLIAWRNAYPGTPEGKAPVFISKIGKRMEYRNMVNLLHRWQRLAGLNMTPTHYMRKSRATNLVLQKMPEYVVKSIVWNNQKTTCYDAYVHATEKDVRDGLLVNYGLKQPTDAQTPVIPIQCPACRFVNAPDSSYCRHCGLPLTNVEQDILRELEDRVDSMMERRRLGELSDVELITELRRRRRCEGSEKPQ